MSPILRVGLSALIAYCGTIETVRNRKSFIASVSQIGSSVPSSVDVAADVAHARVEADQALPERRLAAAGLAGEPHDLAVRERERDAVERLHVAGERAVVDPQVVDEQAHRITSPAASG